MQLEQALARAFVRQQENGFLYHIPADYPAFKGHFEGNPLLPAVCQMSLCADALSRKTGKKLEIAAVGRSKFMRPILPETDVLLALTERDGGRYLAELIDPKTGQKFSQLIFSAKERIL